MGGACGTYGEQKNTCGGLVKNLKKRDSLDNLNFRWRVILKWSISGFHRDVIDIRDFLGFYAA
jgi:hypothetical protein